MCAHVLVCSRERAEEVTRDECVIRFVGVGEATRQWWSAHERCIQGSA